MQVTPERLEKIRSWRRSEWCADVTELASMIYDLVDELDDVRAELRDVQGGVDGLREFLLAHRKASKDIVENAELTFDRAVADTRCAAFNDVLGHGVVVHLWTWVPLDSGNEPGGHG